jgi:hypothetical protein
VARPVKQATPTSSYAAGLELDRHCAELLFPVLTEREEKNSVAIASDESFGGWTKTFTDPRLCAAIVDRLAFNGTVIGIGTDSYRLAARIGPTGKKLAHCQSRRLRRCSVAPAINRDLGAAVSGPLKQTTACAQRDCIRCRTASQVAVVISGVGAGRCCPRWPRWCGRAKANW